MTKGFHPLMQDVVILITITSLVDRFTIPMTVFKNLITYLCEVRFGANFLFSFDIYSVADLIRRRAIDAEAR